MDHLEEIITFLAGILAGITGIGIVHNYQPIMTEPGQIPATFGESGSLHFWAVGWEGTDEIRLTNWETELHHHLLMRHYMEVVDPAISESLFRQLTRTVAGTFRETYRIGAGAGVVIAELVGPVQTTAPDWRILGQTVVTHYAECRIMAQELIRRAG